MKMGEQDGPIVLFFYPAAMTPGCTKEALSLSRPGIRLRSCRGEVRRDLGRPDREAGPVRHEPELRAARQVEAVKRTTFVIGTDRTVLDVIASELSMDTHADKALETLRSR